VTAKLKLHTLLGTYPNTRALHEGRIPSDLVEFDFAEVKVANTLFKGLVREHRFDAGEIASVTILQAKHFGTPYILLPAVVVGRAQHHTIAYNPAHAKLAPGDLEGKRVGARAYTVTTGMWVRGILATEYGVDTSKIKWVTFEDPHIAQYRDPPFCEKAPAGKTLPQMLLDGELDAGVVGDTMPAGLAPLIPEAQAAARRWALAHGGVPLNHLVVVRDRIAKERPDVVREIYRMLREARAQAAPPPGDPLDPWRFGVEENRASLEMIIGFCVKQQLIPKPITVDELFAEWLAISA
jgi:4,5-dihydroxyphthalate decarboxylase